jgi:site-specific DNA-methyltransferase (adenine-specific)
MNIIHGDSLDKLKELEDNSIDSIVTDPPYGLSFMGKKWDYDVPSQEIWEECLRVLKPGGYLLAFAGTRTQHRMAVRIEDAGFEIRDMIAWVYGSGFPKSHNIGKAVDKLQGNEREVVGKTQSVQFQEKGYEYKGDKKGNGFANEKYWGFGNDVTKGNSPYEGWGTALKPALEPITVARKPILEKTVAQNVLKYGCGGINIDACRVVSSEHKCDDNNAYRNPFHKDFQKTHTENTESQDEFASLRLHQNDQFSSDALCVQNLKLAQDYLYHCSVCRHQCDAHLQNAKEDDQDVQPSLCDVHELPFRPCEKHDNHLYQSKTYKNNINSNTTNNINIDKQSQPQGRFPANLIHDGSDEVVGLFPNSKSSDAIRKNNNSKTTGINTFGKYQDIETSGYSDSGSASRFFYCAKSSKTERNKGLEEFEEKASQINLPQGGIQPGNTRNHKTQNFHPTVKPISLMQYLVRLVTPKGGIVLDPFMGSGTTGIGAKLEGFDFIGIEREAEYIKIAEARINAWEKEKQKKLV